MSNQSFYINVAESNSETYRCYELTKDQCIQLKDLVTGAFSNFSLTDIKENFIEHYKEENGALIISLYYFIHLHFMNMDKELLKVVDEQKHNTFAVIIDDNDVIVFSSSPQNNKNDAEQWGAFLIDTYNKTMQTK
jgi:hypothetical protein